MGQLDGKVALITGGSKGMGAAEAHLFAAAGATVIITDVLEEQGRATAAAVGDACEFIRHDVTSESEWADVIATIEQTHGKLDVLVNNAGIASRGGRLLETSLDDWNQTVAVNQTGVFLGMRTAAPLMAKAGSGSIINISSIAGLKSTAREHAYGATKWAVRGMSKSAAVELGPSGIRVNSVHPGIIDTDMLAGLAEDVREGMTQRVPLGRLAQPEEVGKLVLFLASDDSSYCSGHEFVIDGAVVS